MDCFIGVDTKHIEEETGYSLADFKHAYFRCFYIKLGTTVCADVADQVEQMLGFKLKHPFEVEKLGKALLFIGAAGVGNTIFFHNLLDSHLTRIIVFKVRQTVMSPLDCSTRGPG